MFENVETGTSESVIPQISSPPLRMLLRKDNKEVQDA